jgi:hypothetical protein
VLALAEAIRLEGDITINMTSLAFIDGSNWLRDAVPQLQA